jgi:small subunit ribosomal protein S6
MPIHPSGKAHRLSSAVAMAPNYDLFVLLDPEAPEERRTAVLEQVKSRMSSGGATLKGDADWGMRRLSYEIDHRREAQYHLFQFEGTPEVLTQLDRSLSIDDSVLRHRIIRLTGDVPETTPTAPEEAPRRSSDDRGGPRDRRDAEPAADGEGPAAPPAEAAAEEAAEVPAEAPAAAEEAPGEAAGAAAVEAPVEAPGEAPGEAPVEAAEAPAEPAAEAAPAPPAEDRPPAAEADADAPAQVPDEPA